jgi:peptidoglycan hydrolase CwlO-like protein
MMKKVIPVFVSLLLFTCCASQKPLLDAIKINETKIIRIESRLQAISMEISYLKRSISQTVSEIEKLSGNIQQLHEKAQLLDTKIDNIKIDNIKQLEKKILILDRALERLREKLKNLK